MAKRSERRAALSVEAKSHSQARATISAATIARSWIQSSVTGLGQMAESSETGQKRASPWLAQKGIWWSVL